MNERQKKFLDVIEIHGWEFDKKKRLYLDQAGVFGLTWVKKSDWKESFIKEGTEAFNLKPISELYNLFEGCLLRGEILQFRNGDGKSPLEIVVCKPVGYVEGDGFDVLDEDVFIYYSPRGEDKLREG